MLFPFFLTLVALAATTSVFGKSAHGDKRAEACARELEAIVFSPPNCAKDYMRKITQTIVVQSPLLWTDRAVSVIETFENQYGVKTYFFDAFGNLYNFGTGTSIDSINAFNYPWERTVAIGEAFASFSESILIKNNPPFFTYSTLLWNAVGEQYTIFVILNKTNAPFGC